MSELGWNDADADEAQNPVTDLDAENACARCNKPGALYDGVWHRPEGPVCWVCVDAEFDPEDRDDNEYWTEMMAQDAELLAQQDAGIAEADRQIQEGDE